MSEQNTSCKDWYNFLSFPYLSQVRLPEQVARCDVMAIITCNYNPSHTSALMVRVYYGSHQSVYLYNTQMMSYCTLSQT